MKRLPTILYVKWSEEAECFIADDKLERIVEPTGTTHVGIYELGMVKRYTMKIHDLNKESK